MIKSGYLFEKRITPLLLLILIRSLAFIQETPKTKLLPG